MLRPLKAALAQVLLDVTGPGGSKEGLRAPPFYRAIGSPHQGQNRQYFDRIGYPQSCFISRSVTFRRLLVFL